MLKWLRGARILCATTWVACAEQRQPYLGGWPQDACAEDTVGMGHGVGQVARDFALVDPYGEAVHLHDFCDHQVALVAAAAWCEPCLVEAPELGEVAETYEEEGLLLVVLMGENRAGDVPDVDDLGSWAVNYGGHGNVIVLSDPGFATVADFEPSGFELPTMELINRESRVWAVGQRPLDFDFGPFVAD